MKANRKTKKKTRRESKQHAGSATALKANDGGATEKPKDIEALSQEIRARLEDAEKEAALNNYEVGEMVNEAADNPAAYGLPADAPVVKLIAEKVGYKKDSVYNGAKVAKAWPRKDFTEWRTRKGKDGCVLSFAHFVEAVKVKDPTQRDAKLDEALTEGLSTRDLRRICKKPKGARRTSGRRLLQSSIALSEKCLDVFGKLAELCITFNAAEKIAAVQFDRASELQHQLKVLCEQNAKALAKKFNSLKAEVAEENAPQGGAVVHQLPVLGASNTEPPNDVAAGGAA